MDEDLIDLENDRELVLAAVRQRGWALAYASSELRGDKQVVLEALRQNGDTLSFASEELRGDKEIVLAAVQQVGSALQHASKELQADRDLVLAAVKTTGWALQSASEELRSDREVVLEAVRSRGNSLQFASDELRADRDVALAAIAQNPGSWRCMSHHLQRKQDVLLFAARQLRETDDRYDYQVERKAIIGRGLSQDVIESSVAVQGEEAPIASVSMLQPWTSASASASASAGVFANFQCEVSLLSGASFLCCLPPNGDPTERPHPTVNELATLIVESLPQHAQITNVERVFINICLNDDGDAVAVTPWDWNRCLSDFQPPSQ